MESAFIGGPGATRADGRRRRRSSIARIGGPGSIPTGYSGSVWANGKVVKAKALTKKRRSIAAPHGIRGFSPAFGTGLQSPGKGH